MGEALGALPRMGPPLPGLPEGSRVHRYLHRGTQSPNLPAPVSSLEEVTRRRTSVT